MLNQSGKIVLVLILLLLVIGALVYFFLPVFKRQEYQEPVSTPLTSPYPKEASKSSVLIKDYYSKVLKISFKVPTNAEVSEKNSYLLITLPIGKISITFNGTNFGNIREYFNDLKKKNKITPLSYLEGDVNGYNFVMISDEELGNESKMVKTYFIYSNNRIFAFSTSDEALYPVLDQIVQSFEYKGTLSSSDDNP